MRGYILVESAQADIAQSGDQAQCPEAAGVHHFLYRHAPVIKGSGIAALLLLAIGQKSQVGGAGAHHQPAHRHQDAEGDDAQHPIGLTPAHCGDQLAGQGVEKHSADAAAHKGHPDGKAPSFPEPVADEDGKGHGGNAAHGEAQHHRQSVIHGQRLDKGIGKITHRQGDGADAHDAAHIKADKDLSAKQSHDHLTGRQNGHIDPHGPPGKAHIVAHRLDVKPRAVVDDADGTEHHQKSGGHDVPAVKDTAFFHPHFLHPFSEIFYIHYIPFPHGRIAEKGKIVFFHSFSLLWSEV